MKVYVLEVGGYDTYVHGVFSSVDKAKAALEEAQPDEWKDMHWNGERRLGSMEAHAPFWSMNWTTKEPT